MEKWLYVMIIKKGKSYNKVTKAVIIRHVENLKNLDSQGKIELCGPFKGYSGVWSCLRHKAMRRPKLCVSKNP